MMKLLAASVLFACASLSSPARAAMELSKYPRAYKGGEGLLVKIVSVKGEKKQALIEVTGVDTEIDGVVFLGEEDDGGKSLKITLHGKDYWPMRSQESWYGWKQISVFLPEHSTEAVHVHYDEGASKKIDADEMLKIHNKQMKDGTIKELAKWNRATREKNNEGYYAKEREVTEKRCDMKFTTQIDWKSVTDDHLKTISISGYCEAPLTAMRMLCERSQDNKKAAVKAKVKRVLCTLGESGMKLTLGSDGTLTWKTAKDASNADEFAKSNLENQL